MPEISEQVRGLAFLCFVAVAMTGVVLGAASFRRAEIAAAAYDTGLLSYDGRLVANFDDDLTIVVDGKAICTISDISQCCSGPE